MDKNGVIGMVLIFMIIIGYTWYTAPTEEQRAQLQAQQDSLRIAEEAQVNPETAAAITQAQSTATASTAAPKDSTQLAREEADRQRLYGIFSQANTGEDADYIIENDVMQMTIGAKGGTPKKLILKEYKTYAAEEEDKKLVTLFDESSEMDFHFKTTQSQLINTRQFYFEPVSNPVTDAEGNVSMTMRLRTSNPEKYIDLIYGLKPGSYEVDMSMQMRGMSAEVDLQRTDLMMHWSMNGLFKEKSLERENERSSIFYRYMDDEREYMSESSDEEMRLDKRLNWMAFKQNFFSAVVLSEKGFPKDGGYMEVKVPESDTLTKQYYAELAMPVEFGPDPYANWKLYLGPNEYQTLKAYDNEMDRIIDLGWGIFGWMNKWLVIPIFNFLNNYIASYGIIILILTIVIKGLLFPLTYKNYLSSAKMKAIKPEIEALNKKFENEKDPMKKQQATMALYRKSGVNPAAGCVPMLIQMPILYAMFRFFPASIELRQQSFLWADDLSAYDSIVDLPFDIPFYGAHVSLFTVLMAASTFFYTRMNSSQMPASQPGMPNMKAIMNIFPLMMLFFFNGFAAGLSFYYFLANLFSIGQMFVIKNYIIDDEKLRSDIMANQKKPKKKSNFQKRLEDAAKRRGYPTK